VKRILIFPGGSEVGLEILRSLAGSLHFQPVGATSEPDHSQVTYREVVPDIPWATDPRLVDNLAHVCRERDIHAIFPAHDEVSLVLSRAAEEGSLPVPIAGPGQRACWLARSKSRTYDLLSDAIPVPAPVEHVNHSLPVFAKPDRGQGSKGARRIDTPDELAVALADESLVVREYLPGPELTVDCFTDRTATLRYWRARTRTRLYSGISARSEWVDVSLGDFAAVISERFGMRGAWFFQVKARANGEYVLMEVGARVAGTMGLSRASGVNLPLLTLFDLDGQEVDIPETDLDLILDRGLDPSFVLNLSYSQVYMDLDDCLILGDSVSTQAVKFLFQCRNRNIPVHLVTRHAADVEQTLRRFGLADLFASIHHLTADEPKSSAVRGSGAIFIDDSNREREEVQRNADARVFSPQQLDVLIDDRS